MVPRPTGMQQAPGSKSGSSPIHGKKFMLIPTWAATWDSTGTKKDTKRYKNYWSKDGGTSMINLSNYLNYYLMISLNTALTF